MKVTGIMGPIGNGPTRLDSRKNTHHQEMNQYQHRKVKQCQLPTMAMMDVEMRKKEEMEMPRRKSGSQCS